MILVERLLLLKEQNITYAQLSLFWMIYLKEIEKQLKEKNKLIESLSVELSEIDEEYGIDR
ncbi:MAG: hypothetical protein Q4C00_03125 [Bacillota bacterium]|nr:hypothetical protein [Bacillota bacterium]